MQRGCQPIDDEHPEFPEIDAYVRRISRVRVPGGGHSQPNTSIRGKVDPDPGI